MDYNPGPLKNFQGENELCKFLFLWVSINLSPLTLNCSQESMLPLLQFLFLVIYKDICRNSYFVFSWSLLLLYSWYYPSTLLLGIEIFITTFFCNITERQLGIMIWNIGMINATLMNYSFPLVMTLLSQFVLISLSGKLYFAQYNLPRIKY